MRVLYVQTSMDGSGGEEEESESKLGVANLGRICGWNELTI